MSYLCEYIVCPATGKTVVKIEQLADSVIYSVRFSGPPYATLVSIFPRGDLI